MSTLLKLDGRTARGRLWKELNTSGKPLKQGVLLNKTVCSYCNQTPDAGKETINCMSCHSVFHITCLLKPVSASFLEVIADNPSVFWCCPACIGCKSGEVNSNDSGTADNSMAGVDVMLQNTLLTFKRDILTLVGETMDDKLKSLSNAVNKSSISNTDENVVLQMNDRRIDTAKKSYGEVLSGVPGAKTQPVTRPPAENITSDAPSSKKPEKHILLLKPTDQIDTSSAIEQKNSLNTVYKTVTDINVEFCSVKKSGTIAIGFPDAASKKLAEEKIKSNEACSAVFTTDSPKKMLPKVIVKDINEILFDSCDKENRDEMKSVLLKDIMLRNKGIQSIIDSNPEEFVHVVTIQKIMPSASRVSYNAVLKMSCEIRKHIHQNNDKLYISFNRCKVTDRFHVTQCYHCQKPGHYSNSCKDKKEGKLPTCFYCSGPHASKTCPTKQQDDKKQCCVNCLKSNNPDMVKNAETHTAASYKCPIIQSYVKNIKGKTQNWQEKNSQRKAVLH